MEIDLPSASYVYKLIRRIILIRDKRIGYRPPGSLQPA